jgi:hydrogenase-4 component F
MKIETAALLILFLPLLAAICSFFSSGRKYLSVLHITLSFVMLVMAVMLCLRVGPGTDLLLLEGWLRVDAFTAFMFLIISLITFLSCLYSDCCIVGMSNHEPVIAHSGGGLRFYWLLLDIFVFTMFVVVLSNSLGLLWIALESSTLASAFLVGYHNRKTSIEAAWKYILLCTVGITFALNGIIMLYYAAVRAGLPKAEALFLSSLTDVAPLMDVGLVRIAFVFILIGFGTKAGLAPMHNWLPDAHSESPAAISALLSAVLLKCALYAIVRLLPLCGSTMGMHTAGDFLIFFGLFSVLVAMVFLIRQKGLKRFLAYSSLEHIGIMAIGFGIGTPLAVFGAVFHILTHALTKSMLFFLAGNLLLSHGTVEIRKIRNLFACNPVMGVLFFGGGLSLTGLPPFAVFISKFYIIWGAFQAGYFKTTAVLLLLLAFVFFTVIYRFTVLVFSDYDNQADQVSGKIKTCAHDLPVLLAVLLPFVLLIILCFVIPSPLFNLINNAVLSITGGAL